MATEGTRGTRESRRPKARSTCLSETLKHLEGAVDALAEIDLRSTRGELRDVLKKIRENVGTARGETIKAIRLDAPRVDAEETASTD